MLNKRYFIITCCAILLPLTSFCMQTNHMTLKTLPVETQALKNQKPSQTSLATLKKEITQHHQYDDIYMKNEKVKIIGETQRFPHGPIFQVKNNCQKYTDNEGIVGCP